MKAMYAVLLLIASTLALLAPIAPISSQAKAAATSPLVFHVAAAPYDVSGAGSFRGDGGEAAGAYDSVAWRFIDNPSYGEGSLYLGFSGSGEGFLFWRADSEIVSQVSAPANSSGGVAVAYAAYNGGNRLDIRLAVIGRDYSLHRCTVASTTSYEEYPAVAGLGEGFAVFFYNSSDRDYYVYLYGPDCSKQAAWKVHDGSLYYRYAQQVVATSSGPEAIFAYRDEGLADIDIFIVKVNTTGYWDYQATSISGDESLGATAAAVRTGDGWTYIVPFTTSSGEAGIMLLHGDTIEHELLGVNTAPGSQLGAVRLGPGRALVYLVDTSNRLHLYLVDLSTSPPTVEDHVYTLPGYEAGPALAPYSGGVVVAFTNTSGVYAYTFDTSLAKTGEQWLGEGRVVGAASLSNGAAVVFYEEATGGLHLLRAAYYPAAGPSGSAYIYLLPGDSASLLDPSNPHGLIGLIDNANSSVHAALAFFENKTLAQALIDAKNRGVDVGVVTDDDSLEYEAVQMLINNSVPVYTDQGYEEDIGRQHTMHEKIIMIDGRHVVIGTANPTDSGLGANLENVIVYTNTPELAAALEKEYQDLVGGGYGQEDTRDVFAAQVVEAGPATGVALVYAGPEHRLDWEVEAVVRQAEHSIDMAEYIFTTSSTLRYLRQAILDRALSGVEVRAVFYRLLNLDTPSRFAYELLSAGILPAFSLNSVKLHAKTIVVDQAITETGSFNPTGSAVRYNDEAITILYNTPVATRVSGWIRSLYTEWAKPIWRPTYPVILSVGVEGPEFIQIYNPGPQAVQLSQLVVGDTENLYSDDEGLYRFPNATLGPGAIVIVAYNATMFHDYYGFWPDYEIVDSTPTVPDMEKYLPAKFTGQLDFNATGDEAVLGMISPYDPEFIYILDMTAYGNSTALPVPLPSTPPETPAVLVRIGALDSIIENNTLTWSIAPVTSPAGAYAENLPPTATLEASSGRATLVVQAGSTGATNIAAGVSWLNTSPPPLIQDKRIKAVLEVSVKGTGDYEATLYYRPPHSLLNTSLEAYYYTPATGWTPLTPVFNGTHVVIHLPREALGGTPVILGGDPSPVGGTLQPPPAAKPEAVPSHQQAALAVAIGALAAIAAAIAMLRTREKK